MSAPEPRTIRDTAIGLMIAAHRALDGPISAPDDFERWTLHYHGSVIVGFSRMPLLLTDQRLKIEKLARMGDLLE